MFPMNNLWSIDVFHLHNQINPFGHWDRCSLRPMSQTFQTTSNFSHTWPRLLIWSRLWGSLHSCLRPFTEDKAHLSFPWLRPKKGSVGGGVRASEDAFQFMRDDRIQETNVPGSILRLDNAEKNILYISQRFLYKQHLCVACKVTLKTSSVGLPNSPSHCHLFPLIIFQTVLKHPSPVFLLFLCESQSRPVTSEWMCYTEQGEMHIS